MAASESRCERHIEEGDKVMRKACWYFGAIGGVISVLAASAGASTPTFSLKLTGINGDMFRDMECTTDAECPTGSSCVDTEVIFPGNFELRCGPVTEALLRCVGGTTPGVSCDNDGDCGGTGVCAGLVSRGDALAVEAFVSTWDLDPAMGVCDYGDACTIVLNNCTQKHCSVSQTLCFNDGGCPTGQSCVDDECMPGPMLGSYQWTVDCDSYESTTNPLAGPLEPALFSCAVDDDCDHGYDFNSQCTCAAATCDFGFCSSEATAYFELINFQYIFRGLSHERLISTNNCFYQYGGVAIPGGVQDALVEKYVGTLWLYVPEDAMGTYMVKILNNINFTFVTDPLSHRFPSTSLNPLIIELPDPCSGFECPPQPNPCSEWVCHIVDGLPECSRQTVTCPPGQRCIAVEDGCKDIRACCKIDGTCEVLSEVECGNADGVWKYNAPTCEPTTCPLVNFGACCLADGTCALKTATECAGMGGVYKGNGVVCGDVTCPVLGACCIGENCDQRFESACLGGATLRTTDQQDGRVDLHGWPDYGTNGGAG